MSDYPIATTAFNRVSSISFSRLISATNFDDSTCSMLQVWFLSIAVPFVLWMACCAACGVRYGDHGQGVAA